MGLRASQPEVADTSSIHGEAPISVTVAPTAAVAAPPVAAPPTALPAAAAPEVPAAASRTVPFSAIPCCYSQVLRLLMCARFTALTCIVFLPAFIMSTPDSPWAACNAQRDAIMSARIANSTSWCGTKTKYKCIEYPEPCYTPGFPLLLVPLTSYADLIVSVLTAAMRAYQGTRLLPDLCVPYGLVDFGRGAGRRWPNLRRGPMVDCLTGRALLSEYGVGISNTVAAFFAAFFCSLEISSVLKQYGATAHTPGHAAIIALTTLSWLLLALQLAVPPLLYHALWVHLRLSPEGQVHLVDSEAPSSNLNEVARGARQASVTLGPEGGEALRTVAATREVTY